MQESTSKRQARMTLASRARHYGADDPRTREAAATLAYTRTREAVEADAPTMTPAQRAEIAGLLLGAGQ